MTVNSGQISEGGMINGVYIKVSLRHRLIDHGGGVCVSFCAPYQSDITEKIMHSSISK